VNHMISKGRLDCAIFDGHENMNRECSKIHFSNSRSLHVKPVVFSFPIRIARTMSFNDTFLDFLTTCSEPFPKLKFYTS